MQIFQKVVLRMDKADDAKKPKNNIMRQKVASCSEQGYSFLR